MSAADDPAAMVISPSLKANQQTTLKLTPQMRQAVRLLQMSSLELSHYVALEIERNPLIERVEPSPDEMSGAISVVSRSQDTVASDGAPSSDASTSTNASNISGVSGIETFEPTTGLTGSHGHNNSDQSLRSPRSPHDHRAALENLASSGTSLYDHVLGQVNVEFQSADERKIAGLLAERLDSNGWLDEPLDAVAEIADCRLADVERVLEKCQLFDPPGIFSRSLAECLTLQLERNDDLDPPTRCVLANLESVAEGKITVLQNRCGIETARLADIMRKIRSLNPRPASVFEQDIELPVIPDVLLQRVSGGWIVKLNPEALPKVLVNESYRALLRNGALSTSDRTFVSERLQSANWLIRTLRQRANTILKVACELVRRQEQFFEKGAQHMMPLTLQNVADAVGLHESTVSRVTSNKFMATDRGVFELKHLFSQAVGNDSEGNAQAATAIRFRIRRLIEEERPDNVLSDDRIVALLQEEGICIARRTVAKYREAMRIPSSPRRRRQKLLEVW